MPCLKQSLLCVAALTLAVGSSSFADTRGDRIASALDTGTLAREQPSAWQGVAELRSAPISIDVDAIAGFDARSERVIELRVFSDVVFSISLDEPAMRDADAATWLGRIVGEPDSLVTMSRKGGVLLANIQSPRHGSFQIRYLGDGRHEARQIDLGSFSSCCGVEAAIDQSFSPARSSLKPAFRLLAERGVIGPCLEDGSVIDMLVVYTTQAKNAEGGVAAIEALINLAITETNLVFTNSQVPTTINLVAAEEVAYAETGSSQLALTRLIDQGDGFLDAVHAMRDAYKADVVSLIINAASVCGIARLSMRPGASPFPEEAFNVMARSCTSGPEYVFAHELGHNMGLDHDWIQTSCYDGAFKYAKGYIEPTNAFRTVMAYGGAAPRIPHFSNPDVFFSGMPTGTATDAAQPSNAAATLLATVPLVAQFRNRDCNDNGLCDSDEIDQGLLEDCDEDGYPDMCEIDQNRNSVPDECDIAGGASQDNNLNGVPDECEQAILYVNAGAAGLDTGTSWSDAYIDLQDALRVAALAPSVVDEIWVAAGTYTPGQYRAYTFTLVSGVSLYGGFAGGESQRDERDAAANITILSGDLLGDDGADFANYGDNSISVVTASYTDETTTIDGFTIASGNADGGGTCTLNGSGGGLHMIFGDAVITHCIFRDNSAHRAGGMYFDGFGEPTLRDCRFERNRASGPSTSASGGGLIASPDGGGAQVINCQFIGNTSDGTGGGVSDISPDSEYINCLFQGNEAFYTSALSVGGAFNGVTKIHNCIFNGNVCATGSGAYQAAGSAGAIKDSRFINCTIINNIGLGNVGLSTWRASIDNCILWNNQTPSGIHGQVQQLTDHGLIIINNSAVDGWTGSMGGVGNTAADPLFVDLDGADEMAGNADDEFQLSADSPLIDAGDDAILPLDTADLDGDLDTLELLPQDFTGNHRIAGMSVDLGAIEMQVAPCPADITPQPNGDGQVTIADVISVVTAFGLPCDDCSQDIAPMPNGDNQVTIADVIAVVTAFGACP